MGYYLSQYTDDKSKQTVPETGKILKRFPKKKVYQHIKINPNGKYIAWTTNQMGQYKIYVYNTETKKKKKILKHGHKLEQITDYSYPVLAWHPSGRILTFITEEKGGLKLYYYTLATKELEVRNLLYFDKILDFSFSNDGSLFVFSAVKDGKTDIFVHNIASGTDFQVTNDLADDFHPRFINNSDDIIFSSDRIYDSISKEQTSDKNALTSDLFIYNYKNKSDYLMRLSDNDAYTDKTQPLEIDKNTYYSLNDKSGVINRYISKFDSTISYVDTTIHYRYIAKNWPLTNYSRNILEQDYNKKAGILGEIIFNKGRYNLFKEPTETDIIPSAEIKETPYRQKLKKELAIEDSVRNIELKVINIKELSENYIVTENKDTFLLGNNQIDINNYVFEREKINFYNTKLRSKNLKLQFDTTIDNRPKVRLYRTAFYQNYFVNQVDFSFLNESYQAFTGGAVFQPGCKCLV